LAKRRFRNSVRLVKVSEGRAGPYGGTLSLVQTFSLFAKESVRTTKPTCGKVEGGDKRPNRYLRLPWGSFPASSTPTNTSVKKKRAGQKERKKK